jgi:hypothetical protein
METEIQYGGVALSALLTVILALIYKVTGDKIPDRFRAVIAIVIGIGLGLLDIPYRGLECTFACIVDHAIAGFMIGCTAVGLYEAQRTVTKPR